MEECSPSTKRSRPKDEFIRLVFSWSLEDIFNEDLYRNQVEKIPELHQSVDRYLGSYFFPLLEETRAQLASAMDGIYNAPFAEVIALDTAKPYDTHTLLYNVKVDRWKKRLGHGGHGDREPYRTLPGDVVLLLNGKPESVADLQEVGWTWTFASVTNIPEVENDDGDTCTDFKVKAERRIEDEDGQHKSLYVVFLANITTNQRIWNALSMRKNLNIIKTVLSKNDRDEEVCELCSVQGDTQSDIKIGPTALVELNKSQNEAMVASILRMQCEHKSSVKLIWGPPGTGKTRTLSFMLFTLLKMNVRTLVCAPTNVSITNLASRVIKLMRESFKVEPEKSFRTCLLGDVLIFGNKDRLKCGSDIEEILLDYRVKKLVKCFASLTGWKHRISSMICFLEDCVSQHQIYVEKELIKAKQSQEDELQKSKESQDNEVQKSKPVSLLEFARDRLNHTAVPLRKCLSKFFTHLARSFVDDEIFQCMVQLVSLLDSLEILLFQAKLTSEELKNIFSHEGTVDSSQSSVDASPLLYMKTQCLSTLKSLQCSLTKLDFPSAMNKTSIMEFCFKNASLIFCTASSSYKLHSVDIEPIKLLVIDEAAQLKECESIIPLQLLGLRHAVLVGDEWQLPATVISKLSDEAGFGRSLFGRLSSLGHSKLLLDMQYRMHPAISHFPNSNFYQKKIINAPNVKDKSYERRYLPGRMFGPYSFINVVEGKEEMDDFSNSRRNMVEVAVTVEIVKKLYKEWSGSQENLSIGVISPYASQVLAIREKLRAKNHEGFTVTVKSIDGFQGGEKDIIIISTVRSNNGGSIGFLASPQRTNVSLTRARHCLWILGNERTLQNSDSIWHALVHDAKDRRCFFNADEDSDLAKTIIDVKKELDQLDDLLNGESILFKSARWKVLFSDTFKNSFEKLISSRVKKSVMNLLLKIASGWRPKRRSVDLMCESSLQIVKQFKVEGYYIVCTIDIMKELNYMQVLKVWDILPLEMVAKLLRRLDSIFAMYTDDFINHCKEKCIEGNLEVPKIWPMSHDIVRYKNIINNNNILDGDSSGCIVECRSYVENSEVNESLLLMKFYSLSTGVVHHLLSDQDCRELDLPFEVTDEEREIILFPRSSFVLGRSGTGKTTILTMKLYRKIEQHRLALNGISSAESCLSMSNRADEGTSMSEYKDNVLHQLFVTVNPRLCYAIKQHVSRLKSFAGGGQFYRDDCSIHLDEIDQMAQFQDIPDSFVGIKPEKYPLIITLQKFLLMLDGSLGNSYFDRFSYVKDFSQDKRSLKSVALQSFMRKKEVNFDHFKSFYWPRFNSKNFEPSRVYTEIMSHIKGGLQVGEACDIKLNREDYVSLSDRRVSTFCAQEREVIYDIFKKYEKMKMELGEFDLADLVIDLHHRLNNANLPGEKMDFVYVDEVQDLTMRQIALFKYVCKNVDEGFVFSGDTAQTIARGVDFRFQDVRCLFYKEFLLKTKKIEYGGRREKGHLSDMFNLCRNFRTHSGVLRLAQSVIDLLCHFFPHSIDVLPPETSFVYGEPPVVIEPGSDENAIFTIFGCCGNVRKMVCFGAEQVILVRDDSARKEISNWIGHQALILTILECKGLEFQDVLLFNFFGSSPLRSQWRVIYEFLNEKDLFDSGFPKSFPSFSQLRHNILCSELKQLYVAITRTRQRLWICENAEELSKTLLDYWKRLGLVNVRKVDDSLAQAMQRASSPEEWKSQGIKLFWEKNYEMAIMCFERAGEPTWEKRAKAAGLRASADHMRGSNPKEARIMLREAAELFYSVGKTETAAECFFDLEEYERAGRIYLEKSGESELSKAGECFTLAGCYELAADVYAKGNFFVECLSACNKGKCFEIGLQYVEHWKQQASLTDGMMNKFKDLDKIVQEFLESCALDCHKFNDKALLMKFVRAFHTMESRRKFLKSLDCLEDLLVLEDESGNFMEAAEIAQVIGNCLVNVRKVDDSLAQAMQRASSPEEWKSQGIKLFWEKNYERAIMCFERAGEPTWEKRAKAAGLRASADHMRGSNPKEARIMLIEAAELFYSVGKTETAAECFFDLEEYERAGRIYLEKSGESELSKAGECFTLAGCYELAADVYAKGNFFVECLSACNKGKCFEIGLQYVEHWKQQASLTDGMMNKFKDLDKIVQEFLESCALDCHKFNDKALLMKFVRAFHTMESRRKFLKSLDCLEDLLVLEDESGNFMEAAEIAQVIGNLLLEVDLLGKAEHFRNAALLTLTYVLSCSLWDSRGKGWPLKSFPQKQELINKAISFAEKESRSFYGFVCGEVKILLHEQGNVCELMQCFSGSQKHGSLTVEFLSVRKLLDAHFQIHPAKYELEHEFPIDLRKYSEERISQNQLSPRTLFYLWNLFKDNILGILECLDCLEREDISKFDRTVDFCLHYFGVRRLLNNLNVTYRLLNPAAEWVKNIDGRFLRRQREVVTLEAQHFVSAFRTYWLGELQSVGLRVLRVLEALYKSYVGKSLSKYCQGICLTFIFDIVKFFTESKSHDFKNVFIKKFRDFIDISINYFDIVFPLDYQESLSEYIIYLRRTEQSQNLLEKVISRHISTKDGLTYGQIGRAVMILLGSGWHKIDLYEMIAERIPESSSWKEFIMILKGNKELESDSLIQKFHNALQETYNANWRVKGYISPNCYLYLMERLVILASHYRVSFFTSKSSFVEWLVYQQSRGIPSASLVTDKQPYPKNVFDFVITVVKQFLVHDRDTAQWIRDSSINYNYHPVLVLRLFVILCLLCLNSRMYSNVLFELLSLSHIRAQLPREFCEALLKKRKNDDVNLYAVARAFKSIGDPVVIVTRGENDLKFVCPDAIILDMSVSRSEKDIMEVLFPSSGKTSYGQITSVEANMSLAVTIMARLLCRQF